MAEVSASAVRSKYAIPAVLAVVGASLATLGYVNWADAPTSGFASSVQQGPVGPPATAASSVGGEGLTGIEIVDDALGTLLGRSPGQRTVAMSEKGKGKGSARAYRYARSPAAQALREAFSSPAGASRVIEDRAPPLAPSVQLPADILSGDAGPGIVAPFVPVTGAVGGPGPSLGGFFPGGGFSVGGGVGGTPGTPGTPGVPPIDGGVIPPVVPAIPEPSTWLMLILGMAFVGAALRSDRRQSLRAPLPAIP